MKDSNSTVRIAARDVPTVRIDALKPYARNAKRHGAKQIEQLRASLREFGFVAPVLIDDEGNVLAGHGRLEAARAEGMTEVPCVRVGQLSEAQRRAYVIADNRLTELGTWDMEALQFEMRELAEMHFDTRLTGFSIGEQGEVLFDEAQAAPDAEPREAAEDDFDVAPPVRQVSMQGTCSSLASTGSCAGTPAQALTWRSLWAASWRRWFLPTRLMA